MKYKNVKIWFFFNDSPIRLTLPAGVDIEFSTGGKTDEGYDYTCETLRYDGKDTIHRTSVNNARDCDGPLDRYWEGVSTRENWTANVQDGIPYASWETVEQSQRDHYAEAMGY